MSDLLSYIKSNVTVQVVLAITLPFAVIFAVIFGAKAVSSMVERPEHVTSAAVEPYCPWFNGDEVLYIASERYEVDNCGLYRSASQATKPSISTNLVNSNTFSACEASPTPSASLDSKSGRSVLDELEGLPLAEIEEAPEIASGVPGPFIDLEPVLIVRTSVWAAISDFIAQAKPYLTCQVHERTVLERVVALRMAHPEINWDIVQPGMPFMSIMGVNELR